MKTPNGIYTPIRYTFHQNFFAKKAPAATPRAEEMVSGLFFYFCLGACGTAQAGGNCCFQKQRNV